MTSLSKSITLQNQAWQIQASHYSGCGNDFLLFDNRQNNLPEFSAECIRALCLAASVDGASVDGVIIVCQSHRGDCAMRFYNADGHEAEMCGNGVRCLMQFLRQKCAYPRERLLLETMNKELVVTTTGSLITLELGRIYELGWNIELSHNKVSYAMHHLDSGVPHLVIFVDDVAKIDVTKVGRYFRRHKRFLPKGTNVNFVEKKALFTFAGRISASREGSDAEEKNAAGDSLADGRKLIEKVNKAEKKETFFCIRTYERGVEKETLACGTGVAAAGYALAKLYKIHSPITFQVASKQHVTVSFQKNMDEVEHLQLTGPADWICDYSVSIDGDKGLFDVRKCT